MDNNLKKINKTLLIGWVIIVAILVVAYLFENHKQLQHVTVQTISTIANIIDAKDEYTQGHSYRVAEYSSMLAKELGYSDERVQDIKYIGLLHDIGKIGVPDAILNKPGKLSDGEFSVMRSHVEIGGKILADNRMIDGVNEGAVFHHERWDGKGYPKGLSGENIPKIARIIGIADAYDAMTSNRVYRKRLSNADVIKELKRCSGTQFDPEICAVFIKMIEDGKLKQLSPDLAREEFGDTIDEQSKALLRTVLEYPTTDGTHDYLTGAYHLQPGKNRIAEALMIEDGGLFIVDITNVRLTNVKYGLLAGDRVLKTAAEVLITKENLITVRYSGDQFLCFAPLIKNRDEFRKMLNGISKEITETLAAIPESEQNSAAIGGVLSCDAGRDLSTLLISADKALYHIKQTNKAGCFVYCRGSKTEEDKNLSKRDLELLIESIEADSYSGTYNVDYPEFSRIYNLIRNVCSRNDQQMQLVLLTMTGIKGGSPSVSDIDEAMTYLETAISHTLRKVDIMLRFSSSQCIILLSNASAEDVDLAAQRILNSFFRLYDKKNMTLIYDVADLHPPRSEQ